MNHFLNIMLHNLIQFDIESSSKDRVKILGFVPSREHANPGLRELQNSRASLRGKSIWRNKICMESFTVDGKKICQKTNFVEKTFLKTLIRELQYNTLLTNPWWGFSVTI